MSLFTIAPAILPMSVAPLALNSSTSSMTHFDNAIPYSYSILDIPYSRCNRTRLSKRPILSPTKNKSSAVESMGSEATSTALRPSPREFFDAVITDTKKAETSFSNALHVSEDSPSMGQEEREQAELLEFLSSELGASCSTLLNSISIYEEPKGDAVLLERLTERIGKSKAKWLWAWICFLAARKCKTRWHTIVTDLDIYKARWVFMALRDARRKRGWRFG